MSDVHEKEFEELANNIRHWERMRWVSMTVFMAIMAISLNAYFSMQEILSSFNLYIIKIIGIMLVLIFWIQDERIVAYWKAFNIRSHEVEQLLSIAVFTRTPTRGIFSGGTAVRILYLLFFLFWLLQFIM